MPDKNKDNNHPLLSFFIHTIPSEYDIKLIKPTT